MQYCKNTGLHKTVETVGEDPGIDTLNYEFWGEHGDQRHKEHAIRVTTYSDGRVFTTFARQYTLRELAAIAECEKLYDC